MKRILFLLAVSIMFVLAGTAAVSAQGGTPSRDQPPQGQPPQGQPPQGQPVQGQSGSGESPSGQPGQGQQGTAGQPGQGDWSGVVKTVTSSSLTVTRATGDTFTAVISSTTKIELLVTQTTGTVDNIAVGNNVTIQGRKNSDGSVAATRILVEPAGSKIAGSVTAISSATLTVSTQKDKVSVVTSSDTKFYKGKDAITLSDVTKGAFVTAYGTKASDGSLTATYVIVGDNPGSQGQGQQGAAPEARRAQGTPGVTPTRGTPPAEPPKDQARQIQPVQAQPGQGDWSGVVKTVTSSSLTVTRATGDTFTAVISSTTKIELLVTQTTGTVDNIAVGNNVTIQGRKNSDGSIAATRILVEPAGSKVAGSVTAISSATLTVSTQKDKVSVVTSSDTKFYKGKDAITLSDVTKGAFVTAYGTKASDGSLTATYVIVGANSAPEQGAAGQAQTVRAYGQPAAAGQEPSLTLDTNTLDKLVQWLKSYLNMQ